MAKELPKITIKPTLRTVQYPFHAPKPISEGSHVYEVFSHSAVSVDMNVDAVTPIDLGFSLRIPKGMYAELTAIPRPTHEQLIVPEGIMKITSEFDGAVLNFALRNTGNRFFKLEPYEPVAYLTFHYETPVELLDK